VILIEAARRSGSLITAHAAADQGREVMAVPGHPLDPRSEGPNALLKRPGVTMVTSPADVLEVLAPMRGKGPDRAARLALEEATPSIPQPVPATAPKPSDGSPATARPPAANGEAASTQAIGAVMAVLGPAPATLDEVARAAGLNPQVTRVAILELALAGVVERHGSQLVSLRQRDEPESI
jgi:DNA processing protein